MAGLGFEIELLTGTYRAALLDGASAEWPPHPERVFSALVQAWADGDRQPTEKTALEWLEALDSPSIEADPLISMRTAPSVFVPPNDFEIPSPSKALSWPIDTKTGRPKPVRDIAWAGIEPEIRSRNFRQPRTFQVAVPAAPTVRMIWRAEPSREAIFALGNLAARVASLGHSSSLIRMALLHDACVDRRRLWEPAEEGHIALRTVYKGRLADLERWYEAGERPKSPAMRRYLSPRRDSEDAKVDVTKESVFSPEWLVFEGVGEFRPDILGFAHIAKRVRDALMAASPVQPAPELISGHAPAGGPSQIPHLAIIPLLDVGWEHSEGELLGFALAFPRDINDVSRNLVLRAVAQFVRTTPDGEFRAVVHLTREHSWETQRSASPSRSSLQPLRWSESSDTWMSATPVVLDRFPEEGNPIAAVELIAKACLNIGLPEPVTIQVYKHSGVRGAPTSYPSRGSMARPDWSFPRNSKLHDRPRRHVIVRFPEPVRGPVILGAGRYQGFGLCLPIQEQHP